MAIARRDDGKAIRIGSRKRAEQAAQNARFGVGAEVVALGGKDKGKFGIKMGRTVTNEQRAARGVDRDQIVAFRAGKTPGDFDPNKFRAVKGKYGQGYILERLTDQTGLNPEDRQAVSTYEQGTQAGKDALNTAIDIQRGTTGRLQTLADQSTAGVPNPTDASAAMRDFDAATAAIEQQLRAQSPTSSAADIRAEAERRAAQATEARTQAQGTAAGLAGLAAGPAGEASDATAQQIGAANAALLASQAGMAGGPDQAAAILGEGERAAKRAELAQQQGAADTEARVAQTLQQRALERQQLEGRLIGEQRETDAERLRRSQSGRLLMEQRSQGAQGLQADLGNFVSQRATGRADLIGNIRENYAAIQQAQAEAQSEAERFAQDLAARLRGQDTQLIGTRVSNQGATNRARIQANTQRRQQDVTARGQDLTRLDRLEQREQELKLEREKMSSRERIAAAKEIKANRKAQAAERKKARKQLVAARRELRRFVLEPPKNEYGENVILPTQSQLLSDFMEEYPALSEKQLRKLIKQAGVGSRSSGF